METSLKCPHCGNISEFEIDLVSQPVGTTALSCPFCVKTIDVQYRHQRVFAIKNRDDRWEEVASSSAPHTQQLSSAQSVLYAIFGGLVVLALMVGAFVMIMRPNEAAVRACAEAFDLQSNDYDEWRLANMGSQEAFTPRYPNGDPYFPNSRVEVVAIAKPGRTVSLDRGGVLRGDANDVAAYCMVEYDERWRVWRVR